MSNPNDLLDWLTPQNKTIDSKTEETPMLIPIDTNNKGNDINTEQEKESAHINNNIEEISHSEQNKDLIETTYVENPHIPIPEKDPSDPTYVRYLIEDGFSRHHIQNVKIKPFGYHTHDGYVTTSFSILDEETKLTLLIINVSKKQIRYQIPSHLNISHKKQIKDTKTKTKKKKDTQPVLPMETLAKELQKELKYSWNDWF